ncbi:tetratricopeptide repeat protein [Lysobacter enzymogenes]|uniref:tetratricopeptide repeat protein n=1 Tax=Lysobacter enzymogenes TaxID=69 RepID=UPI00384AECDD
MTPTEQCERARALVGAGQTQAALELYDRILAEHPNFAQGYADRGTTHAMLSAFEPALRDFDRAMSLGLRDAWLLTSYASVLLGLRRYDESLRYFDQAIELEPGHPFAYNNRASLYLERGDAAAAIADLQRCLALGPDERTRQMIERRLLGAYEALAQK